MINVSGSTQTWYYYYADAMGSIRLLTDASGVIRESYTYDPHGLPRVMRTRGTDGNWLTEDVYTQDFSSPYLRNPILFTGRWWDSTTQLYHYRAREYSPQLGRFLQPDPIGYADSMNLYQYCGNNPVNFIDPWGLASEMSPQSTTLVVDMAKAGEISTADAAGILDGAYKLRKALNVIRDIFNAISFWKSATEDAENSSKDCSNASPQEKTPDTDPGNFEPVKNSPGKRNKETGEIWVKDKFHGNHYEVYKNKKAYEKGERSRDVWGDGRPKRTF